MKNIIKNMSIVLLALFSCSKKNDASPKDGLINAITGSSWFTESVINGTDGDITSLYKDFSLSLRKSPSGGYDGDYYVANGSYAFPVGYGKWSISDDLKTLHLSSGQNIAITLDGSLLKMDFTIPNSGGRTSGVSGHFTFILKKTL